MSTAPSTHIQQPDASAFRWHACLQRQPPSYLVLSGGGIRGVAYLGAMLAWCQLDPHALRRLKGVAGASAGAVTAFLMALPLGCEQIATLVHHRDLWNNVICTNAWPLLFSTWGMQQADGFRAMLQRALCLAFSDLTPAAANALTFAELSHRTGGRQLRVSVCNVSRNCVEYHSTRETPDLPVCTSVLASMSVPFVFAPQRHIHTQHLLVDGGLVDNVPAGAFPLAETMVWLLDNKSAELPVDGLSDYTRRLLQIASWELQRRTLAEWSAMSPDQQPRVLFIDTGDMPVLMNDTPVQKRLELVTMGASALFYYHDHGVALAADCVASARQQQVAAITLQIGEWWTAASAASAASATPTIHPVARSETAGSNSNSNSNCNNMIPMLVIVLTYLVLHRKPIAFE